MKSLQSINLNLLPVLREVLRKRSVTRAAEALGRSQPAISEALGQLRRHFDDELLVQEGRRYVPTALALRLEGMLETALGLVEEMVLEDTFDPATASGTVRIASNDYVVMTWGRLLAARIATRAPGISLEFQDATIDSAERLTAGLVDFVTLPSDALGMVEGRYDAIGLFDDDLVCLVPASCSVGTIITREELAGFPHVAYAPGGRDAPNLIADVLARESILSRSRVTVSVFSLLPHLVAATGAIALTHRRLAQAFEPQPGVRIVELPFASPKVHVVAVARLGAQRSNLLDWMKAQFEPVCH